MSDKPMTILLIEDDINEINSYKEHAKTREDIKFIGMTDSDIEGLKYAQNNMPQGIILDLELRKGKGNDTCFEFLEALKNIKPDYKPIIFVITIVNSERAYNVLRKNGVDLIFCKEHPNYSPESVINKLLLLKNSETKTANSTPIIETLEERKDKISNKINLELDLIGISAHLQGRKYLYDAIYFLLEEENKNGRITVIQHLVNIYKRSNSTITRAMHNAILHAWRISSVEDLMTHYKAKVNYETGVPTPMEFIYYYSDKIKKLI